MKYPRNDRDFDERAITGVQKVSHGWNITRSDGWSLCIDSLSPVEPKIGMKARFYGAGIGCMVRGVFFDGKKVFYRTEAEETEYRETEMYGVDAAAWLARWDAGKTVWSIEMGGLGPGYEQCIHITAAEILRHLLAMKYDVAAWTAPPDADAQAAWKRDHDAIEKVVLDGDVVKALGLSGAQWGAAMNLATRLYRVGPRAVMTDKRVKNRCIQVSRTFPGAAS